MKQVFKTLIIGQAVKPSVKKKRRSKQNRSFWKFVRNATPFTLICSVIASFYLLYRVTSVAVPASLFAEGALTPAAKPAVVCSSEGDEAHDSDPVPIISSGYQHDIANQPHLGLNLLTNPDLLYVDSAGTPVGYSHNIEEADVDYQYDQAADGKYFLGTTMNNAKLPSNTSPGWLMDPTAIQQGATYGYSFSYRSTVALQLSLELQISQQHIYRTITQLAPTTDWQNFTAHYENSAGATRMRLFVTANVAGHFDTRSYDIHQIPDASLNQGIVSVAFDDGWQSVADKALPLLQKYKIQSTQYIISNLATHAPAGYMNMDTIRRLKAAGQEIGSHTLNHCNETRLSSTQMIHDAADSKRILEQNQLGPIKSFAYPLGQYNLATQNVFTKYYGLIRSSDAGYNDRFFDHTNIHSMGITTKTTEAELQTWLDYAKAHKAWLVIVYHRINESGAYNITTTQLDRQLQAINKSGLLVLPISQAAAKIDN